MIRRDFLRMMGLGAVSLVTPGYAAAARRSESGASESRPNIVLIMSDDTGFSDIGCYGGEIRTPHLNKLAANGLRFTHFYNTARCCPTRASLLTGLYPHQAGVGHMMSDRGTDGYRGDLNRNCVTIAEALKAAGYSTYMAGKWHVTRFIRPDGPKHNWPLQRGFDRFFGTIHGAGSFYDPNTLTRDNTMIPPGEDFYYTDAISDNAVKYINEHKTSSPFFMYVAYTAAHWPMHALPEDIARYKGRYDKGWDALRKERHARTIRMGLVSEKWPLTLRDPHVRAWEDAELKEWHARRMGVYAAMVENMDRGIGRIVDALERKGQLDNTLILFLQDNGGCAEEYGSRGPVQPDPSEKIELKPMDPNELQFKMQPQVTRDGRTVRTGRGVMPGPADTYIAYGRGWANASNTPFRLYKHWVHEGGIATPLVVHWPKSINSGGELRHQPGHLIDIMSTCVDAAGAGYPEEFNGNKIHPMEGKSLVPTFHNKPIEREAIYWEHEGNRAIRRGKWKLVSKGYRNAMKWSRVARIPLEEWELYDLENDRTEMNNLVKEKPELVRELADMWMRWAKRAKVLPLPKK